MTGARGLARAASSDDGPLRLTTTQAAHGKSEAQQAGQPSERGRRGARRRALGSVAAANQPAAFQLEAVERRRAIDGVVGGLGSVVRLPAGSVPFTVAAADPCLDWGR